MRLEPGLQQDPALSQPIRLARLAGATPSGIGKRKIPSPFGKVSLIFLGSLRVYDEWVHEQDLRRGLGLPQDEDKAAVMHAAAQMLRMIQYQTMPRVPSGSTGRVRLVVEGLPAVVVDLGAKQVSEASGSAVATVAAPPAALMMIAAGRDPWRDAVERGVVTIEGDRVAAEVFLAALLAA